MNHKHIRIRFFQVTDDNQKKSKIVEITKDYFERKEPLLIKLPNKKALSALKLAVDLLSTKKFEDIKIIDTRIKNQIILNE